MVTGQENISCEYFLHISQSLYLLPHTSPFSCLTDHFSHAPLVPLSMLVSTSFARHRQHSINLLNCVKEGPFENSRRQPLDETGKALQAYFYTAFRLAAEKPNPGVCCVRGIFVQRMQSLKDLVETTPSLLN